MSLAYKIIEDLYPLARNFASEDYDRAIDYLKSILPFREIVFGPEDHHNGWVIPPKWKVRKAQIRRNGEVIFAGTDHPLSVACHSTSFNGVVDVATLEEHLYYDHRYDDAIPYHFRYSYRPWDRDWGFCVSKNFYDSLQDGNYEIDLETEESAPELKVLEYSLKGQVDLEFVFAAHLDHPGMANDDLAGCAVGIELFRKLSEMNTKFSYRLVLVQELIGTQFYLNVVDHEKLYEGLFLEMLGVDAPLALQKSNKGDIYLERRLLEAVEQVGLKVESKGFRELVGNDEIVFESFGIPMASLVRFPYPEYHCDRDNITIINRRSLNDAVNILIRTVEMIETEKYIKKMFEGLVCLANPDFDLYVDPGQPALGNAAHENLRKLMEHISLIGKGDFLSRICSCCAIDSESALDYLRKWESRGLVEIF